MTEGMAQDNGGGNVILNEVKDLSERMLKRD